MKILIVEDDPEIADLIKYFLTKDGYQVEETNDGLSALKKVKNFKPNLIIMDLMIPNISGTDLTQMIKADPEKYNDPYIIMLTAKTDIEDVLNGFSVGADDYLKKPFDHRELLMRCQTILRREVGNKAVFTYKDIILNDAKHQVLDGEIEIHLSKKEYDLLKLFLQNKNLVLTREQILRKVWDSNYYVGDRSVDIYVSKLREKLPELNNELVTVKGVGYKLKGK